MLTAEGALKIIDFGLAWQFAPCVPEGEATLTARACSRLRRQAGLSGRSATVTADPAEAAAAAAAEAAAAEAAEAAEAAAADGASPVTTPDS